MNHETAVEHLLDRHGKELDEQTRAAVEAHLAGCEECGAVSQMLQVLHAGFQHDPEEVGHHPSSDEIVAVAVDPGSLDRENRETVEAHLSTCVSCRREVASVRGAAESRSPSLPARLRVRSRPAYLALAASLLIVVLGYPAYLGITRLPRMTDRVEELQQEIARVNRSLLWSGAVGLQYVTSPRRDEHGWTDVELDADQPFLVLGIDMGVPRAVSDADTLQLLLVGHDGQAVATVQLAVGEARRQIRETGIVTMVVSTSILPPDRYELRVVNRDKPDDPPIFEAALVMKTADQ